MIIHRLLAVVVGLLFAEGIAAQTASYTFAGQDCPSYAEPIGVVGLPRLGTTFEVDLMSGVRASDGGSLVYVLTGFSDVSWGALQLPFDTSVLTTNWRDTWCGTLFLSVDSIVNAPVSRTRPVAARVPFFVPADPSLLGLRFFQQVYRVGYSGFVQSSSRFLSRVGIGVIGR